MYCRMCGKEIPSDSSFCPSCGAPQETLPPPQTPPQAPSQPLQSTQAPKPAPKKASFLPLVAVILVIAAAIAGFSYFNGQKEKQEKQESLTSYIDEDLVKLRGLEEQLVDETRNLIQTADLDRFQTTAKTLRVTLVVTGADTGLSKLDDLELQTLHTSLYLDYLSTFDDAIDKMGSACVALSNGQNDTAIKLFNESITLMEEADGLYDQFQKELKELADERDVRYKTNDPPFEDLVDLYKDFFS